MLVPVIITVVQHTSSRSTCQPACMTVSKVISAPQHGGSAAGGDPNILRPVAARPDVSAKSKYPQALKDKSRGCAFVYENGAEKWARSNDSSR